MRTWRVGTISMGASLVFLGVLLLLSQVLAWKTAYMIASWWPLLLIVLGIEMLLYLYFSKTEKPYLKYDFLSIVFVGIIGFIGIGFTVMNGVGILDKLNHWLDVEEKTLDLPAFAESVAEEVKRVVVNTGPHSLTIEGGSAKEVNVFGIYRTQVASGEKALASAEDYVLTEQTGDTLYVTLKGLPDVESPFSTYNELNATMVVPTDVQLEVIGNHRTLTLKPRSLASSWSVSDLSELNLLLAEDADVTLSAENIMQISGQEDEWNFTNREGSEKQATAESAENMDSAVDHPKLHSGTLKLGSGTNKLGISNTDHLNVSLVN